jgi:murein peptide amidase A
MIFMRIMFKNINSRMIHAAGRKIAVIAGFWAVLSLAGCYQSVNPPRLGAAPRNTVLPPLQHFGGVSVEKRPIMYYVLGSGSDVTFIFSGIHGDEPAGPYLVNYLLDYLNRNPDLLKERQVVIMPVANPDGLYYKKRFNANNVDINRNFPTENRIDSNDFGKTSLSEPEANVLREIIQKHKPSRIVSIHQPYGCIDYDGPAEDIARQMASLCDLPLQKVGAMPGSLGSYAGETMGIPIITFEMFENDTYLNTQVLWQKYGKALLAAITYPNSTQ